MRLKTWHQVVLRSILPGFSEAYRIVLYFKKHMNTKTNVVQVEAGQKQQINSLADLALLDTPQVTTLYIPEHNVEVYLKAPDALRRGRFEDAVYEKRYPVSTLKMRTCALALCDEKGNLLFENINAHDKITSALGKIDANVIERIAQEVTNQSRLTADIVEDEVKN